MGIILLFVAHVPVALAMSRYPAIGAVHALLAVVAGVYVIFRSSNAAALLCVTAYVVGAEMLWRMVDAPIPWESGKYIVSVLFLAAIVQQRRLDKVPVWPLFYFLFLLPSCLFAENWEDVRFYMSGPLSLMASAVYCSTAKMTKRESDVLLLSLAMPVVSVATLTLRAVISTSASVFVGNVSVNAAAGGGGPNQVSSILGLGMLAAFLFVYTASEWRLVKMVMVACGLWFAVQGMLTFSRGGVYTGLLAVGAAGYYLVHDRRFQKRTVVSTAAIGVIAVVFIIPNIDRFTGGGFSKRFGNTSTTGRDVLMEAELMAFRDNFLTGLGPGESYRYHELLWTGHLSHTEYTRMLSEHGVLGLLALLLLVGVIVKRIAEPSEPVVKAYALSFILWALLFMFHADMRTAGPGYMFGLACAFSSNREIGGGIPFPRPRRSMGRRGEGESPDSRVGSYSGPPAALGVRD